MHLPDEMLPPANLAVLIYGPDWDGGVEGYFALGRWWRSVPGLDIEVSVTGWDYIP